MGCAESGHAEDDVTDKDDDHGEGQRIERKCQIAPISAPDCPTRGGGNYTDQTSRYERRG